MKGCAIKCALGNLASDPPGDPDHDPAVKAAPFGGKGNEQKRGSYIFPRIILPVWAKRLGRLLLCARYAAT
ncbi:MAG: hypothetical protein ACTSU5_02060 [Promethearchaeota archaeon]